MLEHLLPKHDVLLDEVAAVPRQELELHIDRIGFVLQQAEPVDGGAVHGEEVGVVGFVAGIGGLAVLLGGVGVKDADLDSGSGEGELDRTVVASGALDDNDHVLDAVPLAWRRAPVATPPRSQAGRARRWSVAGALGRRSRPA